MGDSGIRGRSIHRLGKRHRALGLPGDFPRRFAGVGGFSGLFYAGRNGRLLGGFFASRGVLDLKLLIPLVAAAAILGDSIGYELGRLLQKAWFLRYGRWLGLRRALETAGRFLSAARRQDGLFRPLLRLLPHPGPLLRRGRAAALPPLSALQRPGRNGLGAGSVTIGYLAGESWRAIEHWVGRTGSSPRFSS